MSASWATPPIPLVQVSKPWYHFLTTTCAIIGGVFTVAGILDSLLYQGIKMVGAWFKDS
jgi:hypothetical protein